MEFTDNLEAPIIYRKWAAIGTIAAALQQRVWLTTSDKLYANLYIALVGYPGVGKTRTIMKGKALLTHLEEVHLGPTDITKASLIDAMSACKVTVSHHFPRQFNDIFNSMALMADEWGVLLQTYDGDMVPTLTTFYDVIVQFDHWRRGKEIKIKIERPQLNILAGSTPSNLMKYMPDYAWDQGFTSRLILVYSAEINKKDDFAKTEETLPPDLIHDLQLIHKLYGEFTVSDEFRNEVSNWRFDEDEKPKPTHPKLLHYNSRRRAHLYKLAMVAAVDRRDDLVLGPDDFHTALGWLLEIEKFMPDIFAAGTFTPDARIMDEIADFVARQGRPVTDHKILRFASDILPAHSIFKVLHVMQTSGRLAKVSDNPVTFVKGDSRDK